MTLWTFFFMLGPAKFELMSSSYCSWLLDLYMSSSLKRWSIFYSGSKISYPQLNTAIQILRVSSS